MTTHSILIAADSASIRTQLRQILTDAGYDVVVAENGRDAVERLAEEPPLLAVLDVTMPFLDGFGVLHEMQAMGDPWSQIPIVLITADYSHALEALGSMYGAYLRKPVDKRKLLGTVERLLRQTALAGVT